MKTASICANAGSIFLLTQNYSAVVAADFSFVLLVSLVATTICMRGYDVSLLRLSANYESGSVIGRRLLSAAVAVSYPAATVGIIILATVAILDRWSEIEVGFMVWAPIAVIAISVSRLYASVMRGLGRSMLYVVFYDALIPIVVCCVLFVLWTTGPERLPLTSMSAAGMLAASSAVCMFSALAVYHLFMSSASKVAAERAKPSNRDKELPEGDRQSVYLATVVLLILSWVEFFFLYGLGDSESAARYMLMQRLAMPVMAVQYVVNVYYARRFSQLVGADDMHTARVDIYRFARLASLPTVTVGAFLVLLVMLYSEVLGFDRVDLAAYALLVLGYTCSVICGPVNTLLKFSSGQRSLLRISAVALVFSIVANAYAVTQHSLLGAAAVFFTIICARNIAALLMVKSR